AGTASRLRSAPKSAPIRPAPPRRRLRTKLSRTRRDETSKVCSECRREMADGRAEQVPIDLHRFVVFCHVAGVAGIIAGATIEWIGVRSLMRATTYEEGRQGLD